MDLQKMDILDVNYDVTKYKGTDWKSMSVKDWFEFSKANESFGEPGVSYEELGALYDALQAHPGGALRTLETGMCYGTTTRFFLIWALKKGGHHTACEVLIRPKFEEAMKELDLWGKWDIIGHSMKHQIPEDTKIDFLFIDSEHGLSDALGEYMRFRNYLTSGAIVGFHDTSCCPGVQRAIDVIQEIDDMELVSEVDNQASAGIKFYKIVALNEAQNRAGLVRRKAAEAAREAEKAKVEA